ncbi:hypothetical protein QVD17_15267 [Tagetes erecta]|uniref:Uncharacterized protein n=1 Tax=Tagetes erecta TaxID=13708 RepID=A0AAD8KT12_TARER|nr:hypothetical protein QVD17_15267 [Tagetes erecta]
MMYACFISLSIYHALYKVLPSSTVPDYIAPCKRESRQPLVDSIYHALYKVLPSSTVTDYIAPRKRESKQPLVGYIQGCLSRPVSFDENTLLDSNSRPLVKI